jgi:hypothetical protein
MFIQDTTPDTSAYMVAGYAIFFVLLILYLISFLIRTRNLNRDLTTLENMKVQSQVATGDSSEFKPAGNTRHAVKRKAARPKGNKSNQVKKKVIKKK